MGKLFTLLTSIFLASGVAQAAPDSYRWWFDQDVSSAVSGSISSGSFDLQIDTSGLPRGLHYFNLQLSEGDSIRGTVYHRIFYSWDEAKNPISYEYWLDDDYANKGSGNLAVGSNHFELDVSSIPIGAHFFNCRVGYADGSWGSVYRKLVLNYIDSLEAISYEYWLDNDYANRKSSSLTGNPTILDVDLSGFDKSGVPHYFNLRTRDGNGEWSTVYHKLIVFDNLEKAVPIIGYRHLINDINLGYVPVERSLSSEFSFDVKVPDRSLLTGPTDSGASDGNQSEATDSVCYTLQLQTELGWTPPVSWMLNLPKLISGSVKISYNGRFITLESEDADAEIRYCFDDEDPASGLAYTEKFDVNGLHTVKAVAVKEGFMNSEVSEYEVSYYADEEHAETSKGGKLEAGFGWSGRDFADRLEAFRIEGILNDADYAFLNSMKGLRHLDIEKVAEARIPDNAFRNSRLISICMPADIAEYGDSILSASPMLSSVSWNSMKDIEGKLTEGLANPNVLLYVKDGTVVTQPNGLNVITSGNATGVRLHYGYPYFAAREFHAANVSISREFQQATEPGVCRGWETLVLPFTPQSILHEVNGPAVPFAAWDGESVELKPFWLYKSNADGWDEAPAIEAGVPYIISMPNHPDYVYSCNLAGNVTFSADNVILGPDSSFPSATAWKDGTQFVGTFMPVEEEEGILSLNVSATDGDLLPGSTFVEDVETVPFGAYVRGASARMMPVFPGGSGVQTPTLSASGIVVETPAPGTIRVSSGRDCTVEIFTPEGAAVRKLTIKAGESATAESLPRGLYIVAGTKVMVK